MTVYFSSVGTNRCWGKSKTLYKPRDVDGQGCDLRDALVRRDFLQRLLCTISVPTPPPPPLAPISDPHLVLDDPVQAATGHRTNGRSVPLKSLSITHLHSPSSNLCLKVTFLDLALGNTQTHGTLIPLTRVYFPPLPGITF